MMQAGKTIYNCLLIWEGRHEDDGTYINVKNKQEKKNEISKLEESHPMGWFWTHYIAAFCYEQVDDKKNMECGDHLYMLWDDLVKQNNIINKWHARNSSAIQFNEWSTLIIIQIYVDLSGHKETTTGKCTQKNNKNVKKLEKKMEK